MNYFEELRADFDTLGLDKSQRSCKPPVLSNKQLYSWLDRASTAVTFGFFRYHALNLDPEQLKTTFGRDILRFCDMKHSFTRHPDKVCEIAEGHIARALVCGTVANPELPSPVIVMDHDRAIGVVKQKGDANYYALQDCERLALHEQCFYQTTLTRWSFSRSLRAPHAWTIDADEIREDIHHGRFAGYRIPLEARRQLVPETPGEQATFSTTHEELVFRANLLLRDAEPISLGEIE